MAPATDTTRGGLPTPAAVMFDMTGTLHPQSHIALAATAAAQVVLARHPHVSIEASLPVVHLAMREQFAIDGPSGFYLLRDLLARGHRAAWPQLGVEVDDDIIALVLDTFESTLVSVIEPYPTAIDVLTRLRSRGIATAIVSVNDEQLLQDCVDACGFRDLVDLVLSSEAVGSCKPAPPMFEAALTGLGVAPGDAVFVGDMPEMDIVGANRVGMRTVLTTEDASFLGSVADAGPEGVPDVTIATLAELPGVLGVD